MHNPSYTSTLKPRNDTLRILKTEMPLFQGKFYFTFMDSFGFITGFIPRLCGINCFYYTIYRVEQFVDSHYEEQCKRISALAIPPSNVVNRFRQCQADEQHHRDEALILMTKRPSLLMKLWGAAVEKGSSIAVAIAKLITKFKSVLTCLKWGKGQSCAL